MKITNESHFLGLQTALARCLKITEKVSFNIASGQKLIKNAQKWSILASFLKT